MNELVSIVSNKTNLNEKSIIETLKLLEEGNTIPFIARYRKQVTGDLDEEQIRMIHEIYEYQANLADRKEVVIKSISEKGKITPEIIEAINACEKLSQVEEIYLPYKESRKTRATEAIANGLEPLSVIILEQKDIDLNEVSKQFINEKVENEIAAIKGAQDIIAELAANNLELRKKAKANILNLGYIETKISKNAEDPKKVYQIYYEHSESVANIPPHRLMAIIRAKKEKVIGYKIVFESSYLYENANKLFVTNTNQCSILVQSSIEDGLKRLLIPSVENEIIRELLDVAHEKSIDTFSNNLEKILTQQPIKNKIILGVDPAFVSGCKLAVIDKNNEVDLKSIRVIYPNEPKLDIKPAKEIIVDLVKKYNVDIIAIGNGTASRETEKFISETIKENNLDVKYTIVSEAGASVYSASQLAAKEFPDLTVEKRSAISIARRVSDPLAELIKIDPKSIGVGQYQHDLPQKRLEERLSFVISKVVNKVGVNLNTASAELLKNISGLTAKTVEKIIKFRQKNSFTSRIELINEKILSANVFKQAAGFLRVEDGLYLLDRTAIHNEAYENTYKILEHLGSKVEELGTDLIKEKIAAANLKLIATEVGMDSFTFNDIIEIFKEPFRDYRDEYHQAILKSDILSIDNLTEGMELQGTIRNVVDFGAFVDIGLKNDALIHISQLSKHRVKQASDIVSYGNIVDIKIISIEKDAGRIGLKLIKNVSTGYINKK